MRGLYVHIPFCRSRCVYCSFYSTVSLSLMERYVSALCSELAVSEPWRTVYIGGGTPSLLPPSLLSRLFRHIDCSSAQEITIECNPDDVTPSFLDTLGSLPVNRVSLGVQSFHDSLLRFSHRRHDSRQAVEAVSLLRSAGITNISIDLIYGFPGETFEEWDSDISSALALGVEHISAYCLSYEQGTPLFHMRRQGRVVEAGEELLRRMYYRLIDRLESSGYEHYEISNFALPGRRSVHNSSYWTNIPYVGIGAAAHSYIDGKYRRWNVANVSKYIRAIESGCPSFEMEELSLAERYNDFVMLSLRTVEGIPLADVSRLFGSSFLTHLLGSARQYLNSGMLIQSPSHLRLSRQALFVSDMITVSLLYVVDDPCSSSKYSYI